MNCPGFDVLITSKLLLKARGELSRLGYDFTGNGAQTRNRDMDPEDQDIAGAADQWVSASASLGYAFSRRAAVSAASRRWRGVGERALPHPVR